MLTVLIDGVASGMLLFVLACGLSVTLGLMNFVNLAHGAFGMAGGYVCVVLLNRYGVSYYARTTLGGFSLIGNRSITGKFISYVGLEDAITRKLVKAAQKAMAKNLTKSFMEQEVKRIDDWIQTLVADETIPGGRVYLHPELNSVEKYKNGTWYVCIDYGRYAPNEHMIYQLNATDEIIEEFLEDVL